MAIAAAILTALAVFVAVLSSRHDRPKPQSWFVGPIIAGKNYSDPVPELTVMPAGFKFTFPTTGGIDGVIRRANTLPKRLHCRVTGEGFVAANGTVPATVCAVFQRKGDNWSATDGYEFYRWYARPVNLAAGEFDLPLEGWASVNGQSAFDHPVEFAAALSEIDNIAIAFGANKGREHGAHATGDATFELLEGE